MHVYKREFSVAEGTEFTLPAGIADACFEIGFPQEGRITRLIVKQDPLDGTQTAFTVDLYDRQVCGFASESSSSGVAADSMTDELAKIIPTQTGTAGNAMELRYGEGYSYRNREGSYTVPQRSVYLQIAVSNSTNESNWEVAIEGEVGNELN